MKLHKVRSAKKTNVFRQVEKTPSRYLGSLCPTNLDEEKEKFLTYGLTPNFKMRCSSTELERVFSTERGRINFALLKEAEHILKLVEEKFGDGDNYMEAAFGPYTDEEMAMKQMAQYLADCRCEEEIKVYWTTQLGCSARMIWRGPNIRLNKPEARRYTLVIKKTRENSLMRRLGILCLADHEIGTHYMRMINDGFQPWFSDRKRFGLRRLGCRELCATEEGLASINTLVHARKSYLWMAALRYYTACMATRLTFEELYHHLEMYVVDNEQRWKLVMRVKRGLSDANALGGCGNDQVYFEGAVDIIRNMDDIDFIILYSGKVCVDEVKRVRRVARLNCIKLPHFLKDMKKYKERIREIGVINGLISPRQTKPHVSLGRPKTSFAHSNRYNTPREYSEDTLRRYSFENDSSEDASEDEDAALPNEMNHRRRYLQDVNFLRNCSDNFNSPQRCVKDPSSQKICSERTYSKKTDPKRRSLDDLDLNDHTTRKGFEQVVSVLPSLLLTREKASLVLLNQTSESLPYSRRGTPSGGAFNKSSFSVSERNCSCSCSESDEEKKQKYWECPKSTAGPKKVPLVRRAFKKKRKLKRHNALNAD